MNKKTTPIKIMEYFQSISDNEDKNTEHGHYYGDSHAATEIIGGDKNKHVTLVCLSECQSVLILIDKETRRIRLRMAS